MIPMAYMRTHSLLAYNIIITTVMYSIIFGRELSSRLVQKFSFIFFVQIVNAHDA